MFMAHARYPMQARAAVACQVWQLSRSALHQACEAHPALAMRLLESLSQRLYRNINQIEWLSMSNAPQRLAAALLQLSQGEGAQLQLPCSQRQFAAQLGMRPETLSRLLSGWQKRCWITGQRRDWVMRDAAPLQRLAGAGLRSF